MLTNADKNIIARDTALPGLVALLDGDVLLSTLKKLPLLQDIVQADIQYLRYKPANSCACTVRVKWQDGVQKYFYAKALTPERFEQSWNNPKRQKLVQQGDPNAPLAIFDLCIILFHPAYDRGIRALKWLVDNKLRHKILCACSLPELEDEALQVDVLRYKPERRLVARIRHHQKILAVVRTIKQSDFSKVLVGAAFATAQGYVKLLGVEGSLNTVITDWQEGQSLCPEEAMLPSESLIQKVASQLAQVHKVAYKHPLNYDVNDEIQSLKGVQSTFGIILPEYSFWFDSLISKAAKGLAEQPFISTLIHGDFSLDQVVLGQNKKGTDELYLLDWDRSANGNPLFDLATMRARLELQAIEGALPVWQVENLMATFLQAYQTETELDLDGLPWFVVSAILRLAAEPFRKRHPNWEQHTLLLLQRAEQILVNSAFFNKVVATKHIDFALDPILNTLTDKAQMQELLMSVLPETNQGRLESTKLIRYKLQRRALVEYQLTTENTKQCVIGKYRSKGLDKRSYYIQKALWENGFNQTALISVPEPLGTLPDHKTWLQMKVSGRCIGDVLVPGNQRLAFLGESVAKAICALHKSAVEKFIDLPMWGPEQEIHILRDRLMQAQLLLPQFSIRIANVLAGCEKLAMKLANFPFVPVHRDFYQDQILECASKPGQMVLLDLDLASLGHSALDAGNYLAHIQEFAIRKYADKEALSAHQNAFLGTFLTSNSTTNLQDVEIYTLLSLARHIYLSTQFPDRKHTTETLLSLCEERLTLIL
ncbi:phosphotransferase [Bisgaard Taxon 46]